MDHFGARLHGGPRWFTGLLLLLAVLLAALALLSGRTGVAVVIAGAAGLLSLLRVRGYVVEADTLYVVRPAWRTRVSLVGLESVEPDPALVRRSLSLWSTRGMFGVVGLVRRRGVGTVRAYVTDPPRTLLLRFRGQRPVAVSPLRSREFTAAIRHAAGGGTGSVPQTAARPPPRAVRSPRRRPAPTV